MFRVKKVFIFLMLGLAWKGCLAQKDMPVKLRIEMKTKRVFKFEDLNINLIFTNADSTKPIPLLQGFLYGFSDFDTIRKPDVFIELEKTENGHFIKQENRIDHHGVRGYHMIYDTLTARNKVIRRLRLGPFYNFTKGEYRVRAIFNIPKEAGLKEECIYSDWLYFKVMSIVN